ncbi:MAG TPA: porin family protein [Ferruginibacter sp.]|jgi:hypothetical protein|nr:porin family protein [Ferruginibacter sp.]
MYKYFVLLLLIIPASIAAQTSKMDQEHENFFRFGGKAGININKVSGQSYKEGFKYNFQLGGFLQFNFSNRFGIQPEVNFVQSAAEFTTDGTVVYDDIFGGGGQHKAKLNYLEVPLLLNINIGPSKRFKFQVGPAYGGLLKQTVDSLKTNGNIYKKSEWSAIAGLWLQVPVLNLGIRFKQGLTNINAIDNRQSWKNQSFQAFIGVTF